VLRRLALGRSNADIAADLGIGEETVKTHVSRLLSKLGTSATLLTSTPHRYS
jgi:DNA-binding NarL/FixJ family response regulator